MLTFKIGFFVPTDFAIGVESASSNAEYKAGCFAVAVPFKANPPVQIKQKAIAKMSFHLFFVAASTDRTCKIGGVSGHGAILLGDVVYQ